MATNLVEQREQEQRDAALAQLRRQRGAKAGELAKLDASIAQLSDADFVARIGSLRRREMTPKQKSEAISRLGSQKYLSLDW
jgi:hypothetical protein